MSIARLAGIFALLNVVGVLATLATGPLQAQALGVEGRGQLAAILVPVGLLPTLIGLGLRDYVTKGYSDSPSPKDFVASMMTLGVALGIIGAAIAMPLAHVISDGRPVVLTWLLVDLALLPLLMMLEMVQGLAAAKQRWGLVSTARLLPRLLALVAIVALFVTDTLTVGTAAAAWIFTGLVGAAPALLALGSHFGGRPRVQEMRTGISFGMRWWLGSIASQGNQRLDQLLMTRLTSETQLGLYAVAAVLANFPVYIATSALPPLILGKIRSHSGDVVATAVRATVAFMVLSGIFVAATAYWVLYYFFGADFTAATAMTCVLLVAMVPLAGVAVLAPCCAAAGKPAASARAEAVAFVITIAALPVALIQFGALGAALVSILAYTTSAVVMTRTSMRLFGLSAREIWVPRVGDVRIARDAIGSKWRQRRSKRRW